MSLVVLSWSRWSVSSLHLDRHSLITNTLLAWHPVSMHSCVSALIHKRLWGRECQVTLVLLQELGWGDVFRLLFASFPILSMMTVTVMMLAKLWTLPEVSCEISCDIFNWSYFYNVISFDILIQCGPVLSQFFDLPYQRYRWFQLKGRSYLLNGHLVSPVAGQHNW